MKIFLTLTVMLAGMFMPAHRAQAAPEHVYSVVDTFPGPDGGYDYISIDPEMKRVFVGRSYGVMAVDLDTRKVIPSLIRADDVSAVLIIPGTRLMLSTNSGSSTATLFDRLTGERKAEIPTGNSPDGALYEPLTDTVFVMNRNSHDATVINLKTKKPVATIPLGGKPEAAVSDEHGHVYVNIENTAEIAVIDVKKFSVIKRYPLPGCDDPTGLAYDKKTGLLISACHNRTAKLVEASTGTIKGAAATGRTPDGAIFDAKRRLVYIPCWDGSLTIFHLDTNGHAERVDKITTRITARTAALDPETGRLYLPAIAFTYDGNGKRIPIPGTFTIFVIDRTYP